MSKLAQMKALRRGKGIRYLLDAAYKILQNPIAMFDTNYTLVAYTDVPCDDILWKELVSTGTFSMCTQEFFVKLYFTEDVANADKTVELSSDELELDRTLGYVFNRDHIKVGALIVLYEKDPGFGEDEIAAFEMLVNKVTGEIHNDDYFTAYGRAYHESIIIKLLDGIINDPLVYTPHVQIIYDGFEDYLFVAVVDVSRAHGIQTDTAPQTALAQETAFKKGYSRLVHYKDLFERKYQAYKYAIYNDYIVIIMSSTHKDYYKMQFFDKNNYPINQNGLYVGISDGFENMYELRKYYDQAVTELKKGMEEGSGQRIFMSENI